MNKPESGIDRTEAKRAAVYEAASEVFARYGFKRTTMNDIAEAAGISRPALYLMFANKEALFQGLAAFRLEQAITQAELVLSGDSSASERFTEALLVFEGIFYEPIADSPHGAELMDIGHSLAADLMVKGIDKLLTSLAETLAEAEADGEISFASTQLGPKPFVELLFAALGGIKLKSDSTSAFRRNVRQLCDVFLRSVST